jgi:hypothetical protein
MADDDDMEGTEVVNVVVDAFHQLVVELEHLVSPRLMGSVYSMGIESQHVFYGHRIFSERRKAVAR